MFIASDFFISRKKGRNDVKMNSPKRIFKRVFIVLLIVLILFSAVSVVFSAVFYSYLFPRQDYVSFIALSYDDIDSAVYPREAVELYSGENRLSAFYYPKEDAKALVVVAGGIGSDCDAHLAEILYFLDSGFAALCYSCTGVGESEGGGLIGLTQPALDLSCALDYADTLGLPIVVYGHSAGAHAAAIYTDERDLKACVCVAGFDTAPQLMHYWAEKRVGILADIEYPFMCLQNFFLFGDRGFESASENLYRSDTPVMLITGAYDAVVPYDCSVSKRIDEVDDPDVTQLCIDSVSRGTHVGLWYSEDSLSYRGSLSYDEPFDKQKANTPDEEYMETVTAFFEKAVLK